MYRQIAKFIEWFLTSDTNICYITYAYEIIPKDAIETLRAAIQMVKTERLQFVVNVVRDLVTCVRTLRHGNGTTSGTEHKLEVIALGFR